MSDDWECVGLALGTMIEILLPLAYCDDKD